MGGAYWIPIIVALVALPLGSCSDDDNPAKPKEEAYKTILADGPRDNVLYNLQRAYNDRTHERYGELLDVGFLFYFSEEDVLIGAPEYWGHAEETRVNRNLFDPNYSHPTQPAALDLDLILTYPEGDDQWTSFDAPDQVRFPGETWYQKTVRYDITVQFTTELQYVGVNKLATFTVRSATMDSGEYWKIIVWRDDTGTLLRQTVRRGETAGTTEKTTWGAIKALYAD
jgi:hypothetical protein